MKATDSSNPISGLAAAESVPQRKTYATVTPRSAPVAAESSDQTVNASGQSEALRRQAEEIQIRLATLNVKLEIKVDLDSGRQVVKIIDRDTGQMVRQIPPEEMLRLGQSIDRMIGVLFNRQA